MAFGSCARGDSSQVFGHVADWQPQLWVWLGDAVYADSRRWGFSWVPGEEAQVRAKYEQLVRSEEYRRLPEVVGVYDDHDYNCNNGGK